MNATFDGARIHQQELDREIETICAERMLSSRSPRRPGPVARSLATVGRGMVSVGTALASRGDGPAASRSTATGGRA
jgi:hypothetical protein